MSDNDYEELDGLDGSEGYNADETNNDSGEENGTPDKASRNKSNFKALSQKAKDLESRAEKAERLAQERQDIIDAWESANPDIVSQKYSKSDGIDKGDLALFLVQNPEAKNHLDEVKEYLSGMKNPDIEKAWKYVKPTLETESKDSKDFDLKSRTPSKKVDLKNMDIKEAYEEGKLTKEQRSEWRKLHEPK